MAVVVLPLLCTVQFTEIIVAECFLQGKADFLNLSSIYASQVCEKTKFKEIQMKIEEKVNVSLPITL
jgi:hypothetical protein